MDPIRQRVIRFFWPSLEVPEEEEHYKKAVEFRHAKVEELRAQLKTDPSLDAKIDDITAMLSGAESKP